MSEQRDWSTIDGARLLAKRVESYWAGQGYMVRTWVDTQTRDNDRSFSCVRSDMLNGYPRSWGVGR